MRPLDGPFAVAPTDPAPGFQAIFNDDLLWSYRIYLEVGRIKNINKNLVTERATIQEVREHILKIDPRARTVSPIITRRCLC